MTIKGTTGNDVRNGTPGDDIFELDQGGDDVAFGHHGDDIFRMDGALTAADQINGGAGDDQLTLSGDYSAGLTFGPQTVTNIESIRLRGGNSYTLTTDDGTVAKGQLLWIGGRELGVADHLVFDGSADTNGHFSIFAGAGDDTLTGGARHDLFTLTRGGDDTAHGGDADDKFVLGETLTAADAIDGGNGFDTVRLDGDYAAGVVFGANTLTGIEMLKLVNGNDYNFATDDATVAADATLTVAAAGLHPSHHVTFDGSAELDGHFHLVGGAGGDSLTGGAQSDTFDLRHGGDDTAQGGDGDDEFNMGGAFTAGDTIDGGLGEDTLTLNVGTTITFTASTMTNVEEIDLLDQGAGNTHYNLTTDDATVAAGEELAVNGTTYLSDTTDSLVFDGSAETDGSFKLYGSPGDDTLTGGAGGDYFSLGASGHSGTASVHGGGGDDTFDLWATLDAGDTIDGGGHTFEDVLQLFGDYSAGLVLGANTVTNIEVLRLIDASGDNFSYNLTLDENTVASGKALIVDASLLVDGDSLILDLSADTDGHFIIGGGAGDDTITFDKFYPLDEVNTGSGFDTLTVTGFTSGNSAVFFDNTIIGVDKLVLDTTDALSITTAEGNIGVDETLTVDATANTVNGFVFDASAESDGHVDVTAGAGTFTIHGGTQSDVLVGGPAGGSFTGWYGKDHLISLGGSNTYNYADVGESTSTEYDVIEGVNFDTDKFDFHSTGPNVTVLNATVTTGTLSSMTFNADLTDAIGTTELDPNQAVVFKPDDGQLAGFSFLIVDANGNAGYQSLHDYVFDITNYTGTIDPSDFVT